jgi:tetratricopeptide (TPR) repeat protein
VAILILGAPSAAQEGEPRLRPTILGRDDAAFARALFQRGYSDLARDACDTILSLESSGKLGFEEVLEAKSLSLDLRMEEADRLSAALDRLNAIRDLIQQKNELISSNSRTQVAGRMRETLPEDYLQLGQALLGTLDEVKDPAEGAQLRAEGDATFSQAEDQMRQRIDRFADQKDGGGSNAAYAERQHLLATWNLGRTLYFHGLLYPAGSPEQKQRFEDCVDVFSDLALDYPDVLSTYQGYIYQGLCHAALDELETALEDYDAAIALRETWGKDAAGVWQIQSSDAADVISAAVYQKILALSKAGRLEEVNQVAQDFYATIPDAYETSQGFAVVAAHADALLKAGDQGKAGELAQLLIERDAQGPGLSLGRGLLAKMAVSGSSPQDPQGLLSVAETLRAQGNVELARENCRKAIQRARGQPGSADAGAQACTLLGTTYQAQERFYEASLAYDLAQEYFSGSGGTPEAVWRAINCYRLLHDREKRPIFEKRKQDRITVLSTQYASHPRAQQIILLRGQSLEDEQKWDEAAKLYTAIEPSSTAFQEAQARAARAVYRQARDKAKDKDEATRLLAEAERLLRKSLSDLDRAIQATLDTKVQTDLQNSRFVVIQTLSTLLLESRRAGEVLPLLEGQESNVGEERAQVVWSLRIQALQAQGKSDEAEALFEAILRQNPDSPAVAATARTLATGLDSAALEVAQTDKARANQLWTKAVHYYEVSIRPQLQGLRFDSDEVKEIADRLYSIGFELNGVPEAAQTYVDWDETPRMPDIWARAAEIYASLISRAPSYRLEIQDGRCLGLLGRWQETAAAYARLFDRETILEPGGKTFNQQAIAAKPELLPAYLEWGVAEHRLGLTDKSQDRLKRAEAIFARVVEAATKQSRLWWQARYHQARAMYDRGEYETADIVVRNVRSGTDENYDKGEFGYQARFSALAAEIKKKVR